MQRVEKVSGWTNAAYPAAGIAAVWQYPGWLAVCFLVVMIYMGITSFGFHRITERTRKKKWQRLDEGAIYISLWFLFSAFLIPPVALLPVGVGLGIFMAFNWRRFDSFPTVFTFFTAFALMAIHFGGANALWPLGVFMAAGGIHWVGDSMDFFWKDLTHGIWHVLTGFGFYLYFELALNLFLYGHG